MEIIVMLGVGLVALVAGCLSFLSLARERRSKEAALLRLAGEERTAARVPGLERDLAERAAEAASLQAELAAARETIDQERRQSAEKMRLLGSFSTEARASMATEFKLLGEELMARHGARFSQLNQEQMTAVLKPLRDKIGEFQQGLHQSQIDGAKERAGLAEQIRRLGETSAKMTSETANLTRALKGEAQTQGAWGEMILTTILERSGLREGVEYVAQQSHTLADGARLRPDAIVSLPAGERVVVDAKVSLTAFEQHVNAADEEERRQHLARHVASLKAHIRQLGGKEYHAALGSGLDYVILFVPIEGALAAALQAEPNLTALAAEHHVAIATPTTLMIALRTIANLWQVERRNRNAEDIADRAGKLYDKFVGFIDDMKGIELSLDRARASYDAALGKLCSGRGNIVRQVDQLKEMGAKTNKAIAPDLLDRTREAAIGRQAPLLLE